MNDKKQPDDTLFDTPPSITSRVERYHHRLMLSSASYPLRNWARGFLSLLQEPARYPVLAKHLESGRTLNERQLLQLEYGRRTLGMWKRMARPVRDDVREEWLCFLEAVAAEFDVDLRGGDPTTKALVRQLLLE